MRAQLVRGLMAVMIVSQAVLACARFGESPAVDAGGAPEASLVQPVGDAAALPPKDPAEADGMRVRLLRLVAVETNFSVAPLDMPPLYDGADASLPSSLFADGGVTLEALPATGSVVFTDNGSSKNFENRPPYTLSELGRNDSSGWQPSVSTHVIVAIPYTQGEGTGTAGTAFRATITITP